MPSSTQFSLRSLFGLTLFVGVLAAAIAPVVRGWNTERQLVFAGQAGLSTLIMTVSVVMLSLRRLAVEEQTGRLLLRLSRRRTLPQRVALGAVAVVLTLAVVGQWILASAEDDGALAAILPNGILLSCCAADLVTTYWWNVGPGVVELRDGGMVRRGLQVTPWSMVTRTYWNRHFPDVLMVVVERFDTWEINVPPGEREVVERLLQAKSAANGDAPAH